MRSRGLSTSSPATSLATACPCQRTVPSLDEHELRVAGAGRAVRRALRSRRPAPSARRRRAPWPPSPRPRRPARSGNPSSRPSTWPSTTTSPRLADLGLQHRVLAQPPHQHAGTAIDEALGQPLVQRIGELVLYSARDVLPMLGIGEPIRPVGGEGPGADMGDAIGERVDIAVGPVGEGDLMREPVDRDGPLAHQKAVERDHQLGMGRPARSCGSRGPGRRPTGARPQRRRGQRAHVVVAHGMFEHRMSSAIGARVSPLAVGVAESVACSAPSEEKSSAVLRHCSKRTGSKEWLSSACTSSVSNGGQRPVVPKVPSRVARPARPAICAELGRVEPAKLVAVELAVGRETRRDRRRD